MHARRRTHTLDAHTRTHKHTHTHLMRIHPHTHTHRTVILDEVDQLSVRGQDVLYRLFELPYLRNSKLILIGVCLCVCVCGSVIAYARMCV